MSENYTPEPGVAPGPPYTTVFLSQRDLGLRVPINFVTVPGVSLSAACFPRRRYEDDNSGDCLSNLLAVGFRRFEIDLFWDQGRKVWSFCPVAIPSSVQNVAPSSTVTIPTSSSSLASLASADLRISSTKDSSSSHSSAGLSLRQISSSTDTSSSPTSTRHSTSTRTDGTTLGQTAPSIVNIPDSSNDPFVSIGPYTCTTTINLSTLTSQFWDFIQKTETTIDAYLLYVIINIHAAAADSAPLSPAPQPTILPEPEQLLGTLFSGNLSTFLYTPENLRSDRENLNASWYRVTEATRPIEDFYTTHTSPYDIVSTEDGWPSESFVEFSQSKRLLVGYGTVDPQMANYNFTGDDSIIFPQGYIKADQDISATSTGELTGGCFFRNNTIDLEQTNSSWATDANLPGFTYPTSPTSNTLPLLNLTTNTTNCGISPILNVTLLNATAHENFLPYRDYSYATIWSWAPSEPKNSSSNSNSDSDTSSNPLFRCATANIDLQGRWVVNDCSSKYYAACRAKHQPYNWTITNYAISWTYAAQVCGDEYEFAVPRTAVENSYLYQAMRNSGRDFDGKGAWVNFNSLDYQGCWTAGGPNATCPYLSQNEQNKDDRKTILVPTVAAIIVLILTVMIMFVKFAGNRQVTKRAKKRVNGKIEYEGVPS